MSGSQTQSTCLVPPCCPDHRPHSWRAVAVRVTVRVLAAKLIVTKK